MELTVTQTVQITRFANSDNCTGKPSTEKLRIPRDKLNCFCTRAHQYVKLECDSKQDYVVTLSEYTDADCTTAQTKTVGAASFDALKLENLPMDLAGGCTNMTAAYVQQLTATIDTTDSAKLRATPARSHPDHYYTTLSCGVGVSLS